MLVDTRLCGAAFWKPRREAASWSHVFPPAFRQAAVNNELGLTLLSEHVLKLLLIIIIFLDSPPKCKMLFHPHKN